MEKILEQLSKLRGAQGALLVSKDGLLISAIGKFNNDPDYIGACVCEMYSSIDVMTNERFQSNHPKEITVESDNHNTFIIDVNEDAILAIIANSQANKGLILQEGKRAANELAKYI